MYHAGAICRIGCGESRARFDGQFGLLRKRVWKFVRTACELLANCLPKHGRKFVGMRRAGKLRYWLSWNSSCQAI